MHKAAELVRVRADYIARILTMEQGKVFAEALNETMTTADVIEWFAEEGRRAYGFPFGSHRPAGWLSAGRSQPTRTPNARPRFGDGTAFLRRSRS
jgi:acyl-CoA reductase-like NAD-dependent aldehyde dehydrogenase